MPGEKQRANRRGHAAAGQRRPSAPLPARPPVASPAPTFAEAVRRASLRYIGPLYVPLVLVISWFSFSDESWTLTAGLTTLGLLAAVALFIWGAWRWTGLLAWAARFIGFGGMLAATIVAYKFLIIGGPLLLCALPMAWPGVTGPDGRRQFWRPHLGDRP